MESIDSDSGVVEAFVDGGQEGRPQAVDQSQDLREQPP